MLYALLLGLCLLSLTCTERNPASAVMMFAVLGDSITLPCALPSIGSCSSIDWTVAGEFQSVHQLVKAGAVTSPGHVLLNDCSLRISQLLLDQVRLYSCISGTRNSSVSLRILNITENPNKRIELHCFLNDYRGLTLCNNTGIGLKWTTEDDTPLIGSRFTVTHPSECFSKLTIDEKPTDHHRKWKCQLTRNEAVEASVSYSTTVPDGVEEVFAAAGESVSLSCSHASSLGVRVSWAVGEGRPTNISHHEGASGAFQVPRDSSLVFGRVSARNAGAYRCLADGGEVLNSIRLHVLEVTAEEAPGTDNLTLTCALTCASECEPDFNLTWSGSGQSSWGSGSERVGPSPVLQTQLFPSGQRSDEFACSASREGVVMATKKWRHNNSLRALAWAVLPPGLVACLAAGGIVYARRKRDKDAGDKRPGLEMSHVYQEVQDVDNEELQSSKRGAAPTEVFYHLLQAHPQ